LYSLEKIRICWRIIQFIEGGSLKYLRFVNENYSHQYEWLRTSNLKKVYLHSEFWGERPRYLKRGWKNLWFLEAVTICDGYKSQKDHKLKKSDVDGEKLFRNYRNYLIQGTLLFNYNYIATLSTYILHSK
jgi:hypothetical protein